MAAIQWRTRGDNSRRSIGSEGDTALSVKQREIISSPSPPHKIRSNSEDKTQHALSPRVPNGHSVPGEKPAYHTLEPRLNPGNGHLVSGDNLSHTSELETETVRPIGQLISGDNGSHHSLETACLTNEQNSCRDNSGISSLTDGQQSTGPDNTDTDSLTSGQQACQDNSDQTLDIPDGQPLSRNKVHPTVEAGNPTNGQVIDSADTTYPSSAHVALENSQSVYGDFSASDGDRNHTSSPENGNNCATHYDHSQVILRNKSIERTGSHRHSFRCSVKRRSLRLLKNLRVKPNHFRMSMSSHTKQRNIANLAVYPIVSTCILDTDDIDKGEVIFFAYSENGTAYTEEAVPICNAGCPKHRIRWGEEKDADDKKSHHGDDYDSGGEFGECDDHQVDEVLADYSLKEAPVHVTSTLGRLPPNHSFESMSTEDFNSSFAYCETEHLNTIRRSTVARRDKSTSSTSLNSTSSRKSRFVANVNKKMSSSKAAWPLRSLWLFLTRQKDDSHRRRRSDFRETMESATRYIRIASHYEDAYIGVRLTIQTVAGAGQQLRDVQTDLISTALKAFFTIEEGVNIAWVNDVPRVIQRHLAVGDARVHFAVPDIRQCVACLLLSPDAATLLRRRECILLKSIAEVLECQEECLVVMQTKPGMESTLSRASTSSLSPNRPSSSPPSPSAVSSLEWMAHIPSFSS